jgi:hypothetical protein
MTELLTNDRHWKKLRLLLAVTGGFLIVIALIAGRLGLSEPGTGGIGRLLPIVIGSLLFLLGLLGKKFKDFYQGTALILLNTAILLAFMELSAIAITSLGLAPSYWDTTLARYLELPYYKGQEWTETYWHEAKLAEAYQYESFVVWRHKPFTGSQVNISPEGIRDTPGADCTDGAYTVYTFGGSSMWGWGSPDWGTIAAYLQTGLDEAMESSVCVINLGEDAYVSTQNLVMLTLKLQRGNIPDAVIFYDGVNDVYAAHESGQAGNHPMFHHIASRFEEREHGLILWLKGTRIFWLAKEVIRTYGDPRLLERGRPLADTNNGANLDELTRSVVDRYLGNYDIVSRLASEYGFRHYFFWQPHLAVGKKPLTKQEQEIRSEMDEGLAAFANAVYRDIGIAALEHENLWYIGDVFDDQPIQIWIDAWGHITPVGNELVAREMLAVLETGLSNE